MMNTVAPKLSRSEWKQIASTLIGVDVLSTRSGSNSHAFNERQIAALGLLSL